MIHLDGFISDIMKKRNDLVLSGVDIKLSESNGVKKIEMIHMIYTYRLLFPSQSQRQFQLGKKNENRRVD